MQYTQFTAKTVEEAIEKGLKELGLTVEQADVKVLEEGKKKLFGSVKACVEIAPLENKACAACENKTCAENSESDGARAVTFLKGLFEILNVDAETKLVSEDEKIEINVVADNTNSIIGKRGATLDAIQTLAGAVANTGRDDYKRVVVDCENYREKRENTLTKLADNLAAKAIRTERKIQLEPMNPYERRVIHAALSDREDVSTTSEGKEPNRYVVIVPANVDPEAPAMMARNERGGKDRGYGRDRNRGNRNGGKGRNDKFGKKPYNRDRKPSGGSSTGGTSLKNTDFFGIFLGKSENKDEE